jgi:phospholipid-binding lipoprotein MlaA
MWRVPVLALALLASGCATLPPGVQPSPKDPWERFNRSTFAFNDSLDEHILKPLAKGYTAVLPSPVRTGVTNFFGNFEDVWSTVNQLLQGKIEQTARMTMRVVVNTTVGIGGVFDPATPMGLERHSEDLGQTLGRWGVPPGPYVVLPIFGPSDVRDGLMFPLDHYVSPTLFVDTTTAKLSIDVLEMVQTRADLLQASNLLNDIALDRYSFLRDAYIARRRSLVYDGNPPDEDEDKTNDKSTPDSDSGPDTQAPAAAGTPPAGASAPAGAASAPVPAVPASGPAMPASAPAPASPASAASAPAGS